MSDKLSVAVATIAFADVCWQIFSWLDNVLSRHYEIKLNFTYARGSPLNSMSLASGSPTLYLKKVNTVFIVLSY